MRSVNQYNKLTCAKPLLVFEFHGSPAGVQEQAETVQAITAEHGGMDFNGPNAPKTAAPVDSAPQLPACNCGRRLNHRRLRADRAWLTACATPLKLNRAQLPAHRWPRLATAISMC